MSPYLFLFIAFLFTNFRKFSKCGVLCPAIFYEKFPEISQKFPEIFSTFSKSKKTIIFAPKIVQYHYINQNLAKFSLNHLSANEFSMVSFSVPTKIVHNHYINQNLAKFSLKTPKNSRFFPKNPKFFKIFGAFGAENLEFYVPKIPIFLEKGSPPGRGVPSKISGFSGLRENFR